MRHVRVGRGGRRLLGPGVGTVVLGQRLLPLELVSLPERPRRQNDQRAQDDSGAENEQCLRELLDVKAPGEADESERRDDVLEGALGLALTDVVLQGSKTLYKSIRIVSPNRRRAFSYY